MNSINDSLVFLQRFLREPGSIASAWPSSRYLARAMYDGLDFEHLTSVVEFGPGSGALTRTIAARVARQGQGTGRPAKGRSLRYLGIERDPALFRLLGRRFPALDFVCADVCDSAALVAGHDLAPVDLVVSGLPLILMRSDDLEGLFGAMASFLAPTGVFRAFCYVHSSPLPGSRVLRAQMRRYFGTFEIGRPVLRNMPPALVLTGRQPRCPTSQLLA